MVEEDSVLFSHFLTGATQIAHHSGHPMYPVRFLITVACFGDRGRLRGLASNDSTARLAEKFPPSVVFPHAPLAASRAGGKPSDVRGDPWGCSGPAFLRDGPSLLGSLDLRHDSTKSGFAQEFD